jgi:hypothetical protein
MNTATAIGTYIFGFLVVVLIGVVIRRMVRGWRSRAELQAGLIGSLPVLPDQLGPAVVAPTRGLYVGSTLAPSRMERINVGDLGYRCKAVLTRYPEGILVERSGASPIWMPQSAVSAVRTERGMAGKVIPILVIRWRLPSGTEIDTGFRSDDRREYSRWVAS